MPLAADNTRPCRLQVRGTTLLPHAEDGLGALEPVQVIFAPDSEGCQSDALLLMASGLQIRQQDEGAQDTMSTRNLARIRPLNLQAPVRWRTGNGSGISLEDGRGPEQLREFL
jgi:hypothetical protein